MKIRPLYLYVLIVALIVTTLIQYALIDELLSMPPQVECPEIGFYLQQRPEPTHNPNWL